MRIVHVSDYFLADTGYQETLLPKWHARHGHDVVVVTSDQAPGGFAHEGRTTFPSAEVTPEGVTVRRLPTSRQLRSRVWLRGLRQALAEADVEVAFCHGTTSPTAFRVARICRSLGVPLIMDNHMVSSVVDRSRLGRGFYRVLPAATRRLMTPAVYRYFGVSNESCTFLSELQGVPEALVELLPLGLDTDLFKPDPESAAAQRAILGIPEGANVVLQTGKLTDDKKPRWLAEAMAPLMAADSDLWLLFVGSGASSDICSFMRPLTEAGCADRVRHISRVDVEELRRYFCAADVVAYPSATTLSAIEAAGCGSVVVMADLPAGRWRSELGIGLCYPEGDLSALTALLSSLLTNHEQRRDQGERARRAAVENFSYDQVSQQAETAMADAIHQRLPGGAMSTG